MYISIFVISRSGFQNSPNQNSQGNFPNRQPKTLQQILLSDIRFISNFNRPSTIQQNLNYRLHLQRTLYVNWNNNSHFQIWINKYFGTSYHNFRYYNDYPINMTTNKIINSQVILLILQIIIHLILRKWVFILLILKN